MLAEAAAELFLEQTYAGTTIEDIAQRAGVSRATFFNYFAAKSDLLWVEVDESLAQFERGPRARYPATVPVHDGRAGRRRSRSPPIRPGARAARASPSSS